MGQKLAVMILHTFYAEKDCKSYIVTSGGPFLKFIRKEKVKVIRLPVQSKNPILIFIKYNFFH